MSMLSIDRIRVFVAVAREGGFSAAARKLNRSQSAVSHAIAELEADLGVTLFDRSGWKSTLTPEGKALLADSDHLVSRFADFAAKARGLQDGIEAELAIVVDSLVPQGLVTGAIARVAQLYASTPIHIEVSSLIGVARAVLDGRCQLALMASYPRVVPGLHRTLVGEVPMAPVVAPSHPLAGAPSPIHDDVLKEHVQLVLTAPTGMAEGRSFGIQSVNLWRLTDLSVKHNFLLSGFGWGNMPIDRVEDDLRRGTLVTLDLANKLPRGGRLPIFASYRPENVPGKVGRAFIAAVQEHSGMPRAAPAAQP
jgi:DNA-binding transcriptional LysR family regulator